MTTIDANEPCEVECPDCGGEGSYESDEFSHRSGHYTKPHKCATCNGTGTATETVYETEVREHGDAKAEVARLRRELSVAHERIVALTKRLQAARSGGDGGAATPAVSAGPQDRIPDTDPTGGVGITLGV